MRQQHAPIVKNGWAIYAHPLFIAELNDLIAQVEALKAKTPTTYKNKNATKRLAAIRKLALEAIPRNPAAAEYRQGKTLGPNHKHWFRAKFFQQYRLFFRFHAEARIIIHAWVNDENHKRAYDNKSDAYQTFKKMLDKGHPPDDWEQLHGEATRNHEGLRQTLKQPED